MANIKNTAAEIDEPSVLIPRLAEFYNKNPEYKTSIVEIAVLAQITGMEMNKFIRRPHRKITNIYFDNEGPRF